MRDKKKLFEHSMTGGAIISVNLPVKGGSLWNIDSIIEIKVYNNNII